MMNGRQLSAGILALAGLLLVSAPARADVCGVPQAAPLVAGQHYTAGTITIANDENNLYVQYQTDSPWMMSEAHAMAATTLAGIPQSKSGNPIPGRFSYSATFDPQVSAYTFAIPLSSLTALGNTVYVAAHAVVQAPREAGGSQTAWGYGPDFPGNNWATYIMYSLQPCGGGGNA